MGEQPNTGAYDFPAGRTPIPNTVWVRPPDKPDMAPIAQYILLAVAGATLIISGFNTPERHIGDIDGYHFDVVTSHGGMLMGGCLIINFLVVSASFPLRFRKRPRIGRMAK